MTGFLRKIKAFRYQTTEGIRNLIKWFPIVWKDRDFDSSYIMEILLFKMKNTRDLLNKTLNENSDDERERSTRLISECIDLLSKVHNDYVSYIEPEMERFEEKWPKIQNELIPVEGRPRMYQMIDVSEKLLTEEQIEDREHALRIHYKIAENNRKRDFENAMAIFVENYDYWWD
jgi:hypothetical protein